MTDLDELRKLAEAATPGPWVVQQPGENDPGAGTVYIDTHAYEDGPYPVVAPSYPISEADAAYIAALVNWHRETLAISSSSATETQDGPRTDDEFRERACPSCGAALAPADTHWNPTTDAYECPVATETQDGERPEEALLRLVELLDDINIVWADHPDLDRAHEAARAVLGIRPWTADPPTPTPDDRDREVERIALARLHGYVWEPDRGDHRAGDHFDDCPFCAVIHGSGMAFPEADTLAIWSIDAGLRASGGD